jgi:hypothetical protein
MMSAISEPVQIGFKCSRRGKPWPSLCGFQSALSRDQDSNTKQSALQQHLFNKWLSEEL